MPIKVLLVDDSAVIRGLMAQALAIDPDIVIAGRAGNGSIAIDNAKALQPDVIVLDIEMPVMSGIEALPELLKVSPHSKIVMASTLTERNAAISLQALSLGATDYLAKPSAKTGNDVDEFHRELRSKIRVLGGLAPNVASASPTPLPSKPIQAPIMPVVTSAPKVNLLTPGARLNPAGITALAIASSTGGPQALTAVLTGLKGHLNHIPIFITQHMPPTFTTLLADNLSKIGERPCSEAKHGEIVKAGCAYLAPGNFHMTIVKDNNNQLVIQLNQNPQENFCRPSADPMLRSLCPIYENRLALVVLTGMGQDGMEGAKEVVRSGGSVIAQNEASCVVYGMPKAVVDQGLCKAILPLADISGFLIDQIDKTR